MRLNSDQVLGLSLKEFLLPSPSGNDQGCRRAELRRDTASAIQNRVPSSLKIGHKVFVPVAGHANLDASLLQGTSALGFLKDDRNDLGGWFV